MSRLLLVLPTVNLYPNRLLEISPNRPVPTPSALSDYALIVLLVENDADVRRAAAPTMREAAVGFGEAVFLSRFRDKGVEIIHVETPTDPARSFIHPGLGCGATDLDSAFVHLPDCAAEKR